MAAHAKRVAHSFVWRASLSPEKSAKLSSSSPICGVANWISFQTENEALQGRLGNHLEEGGVNCLLHPRYTLLWLRLCHRMRDWYSVSFIQSRTAYKYSGGTILGWWVLLHQQGREACSALEVQCRFQLIAEERPETSKSTTSLIVNQQCSASTSI